MDDDQTRVWAPKALLRKRDCAEWIAVGTTPPSPTSAAIDNSSPPSNQARYTRDSRPLDPKSVETPPDLPDSLVGSLLGNGRYRVTRLIDRGGQACVYQAEDTLFHVDVAIKAFIGNSESVESTCLQNFWAVKALAQINSPHVVRTLDMIGDKASYHHVMEYIEGESLAAFLSRNGPISWRRAAAIGIQLCDALTALHEHNAPGRKECITHRDIKPANILRLTSSEPDSDHVKVIDLGAAKRLPRITRQVHMPSQQGPLDEELPITWSYCAPEQDYYARGLGIDLPTKPGVHTDIFQVGEVLYELVTGVVPFPYQSRGQPSDTRRRLYLDGSVRLPSALRAGELVPPLFDRVILTSIEKWPEHRFPDARTFRAALEETLRRSDPTRRFRFWQKVLHYLMLVVLASASIIGGSRLVREIRQDAAIARTNSEFEDGDPAPGPSAVPSDHSSRPPRTAPPPSPPATTTSTAPLTSTESPASDDLTSTGADLPLLESPTQATTPSEPDLKALVRDAANAAARRCKRTLSDSPTPRTIHMDLAKGQWTIEQDWLMDLSDPTRCIQKKLKAWGLKTPAPEGSRAFDVTLQSLSKGLKISVNKARR